jgi:hypothetical protein
MYHIALCTPCITLVNCDHLFHMQIDHAEPKMKIRAEQVQKEYGGPRASSYEDTNIVGSRQAPVHLTTMLEFYL